MFLFFIFTCLTYCTFRLAYIHGLHPQMWIIVGEYDNNIYESLNPVSKTVQEDLLLVKMAIVLLEIFEDSQMVFII